MNRLIPFVLTLAALLAGCSDEQAPLPPLTSPLPTAETLPNGINQDCGCVRDGECATLEQIPGAFEVRGLSCRWVRAGAVASCRFEQRFVALHPDPSGNLVATPDEWNARTLRATLLPSGVWCAG